jgi:ELWxxDGT repeat protein
MDFAGTLFFRAYDATSGEEFWKSDGTAAGTVMVKDVNPGGASSVPGSMTDVGGTLFFRANDGTNGRELWTSDGTAGGTFMVKDINPGGGDSSPQLMTDVGGTLFLNADDGTYGIELWAWRNQAPVAINDTVSNPEDVPLVIAPLVNDWDSAGEALSLASFTQAVLGTVTDNGDDTVTYTPPTDFSGVDIFTYTVSDPYGVTSSGAVSVTVTPENDPPVAADDAAETRVNDPVIVLVLDNDTDVDGDTLSVSGFTQGTNGTVTDNFDGTLTYTPDSSYEGGDTFDYTASDGNGGFDTATVTVTVSDTVNNTPPVAVSDALTTIADTPVMTGNVLANDTDADSDMLSVSGSTQPSNGAAADNGDGTFTYTPDPGYTGFDSFTYTVSDGNGGTDIGEVIVLVQEPASSPGTLFVPVAGDDGGCAPGASGAGLVFLILIPYLALRRRKRAD